MHNCTYAYPSNCARRKIGFLQDVAATSCDAFPDMFDVYLYLVVNRVRHNLLWITMDSNYLKDFDRPRRSECFVYLCLHIDNSVDDSSQPPQNGWRSDPICAGSQKLFGLFLAHGCVNSNKIDGVTNPVAYIANLFWFS